MSDKESKVVKSLDEEKKIKKEDSKFLKKEKKTKKEDSKFLKKEKKTKKEDSKSLEEEKKTKKEDSKIVVFLKQGFKAVKKALSSSIAHMIDSIKQDLMENKKETKRQDEGDSMVSLEEPLEGTNVDILNGFSNSFVNVSEEKIKDKQIRNKQNSLAKKDNKKEPIMSGAMFYFGINLLFYLVVIYIIAFGANKAYGFSYQVFGDVAMEEEPGRKVEFTIGTGESKLQVAQSLLDKKLIKSKYAFLIRLNMGQKEIVPNEYKLTTAMNYGEIIEKICNDEKGKDKS